LTPIERGSKRYQRELLARGQEEAGEQYKVEDDTLLTTERPIRFDAILLIEEDETQQHAAKQS